MKGKTHCQFSVLGSRFPGSSVAGQARDRCSQYSRMTGQHVAGLPHEFRARKRRQADDRSRENETGERRLGGAAVRRFGLMKCGGSTSHVITLQELVAICVAAEF